MYTLKPTSARKSPFRFVGCEGAGETMGERPAAAWLRGPLNERSMRPFREHIRILVKTFVIRPSRAGDGMVSDQRVSHSGK